MGDVFSNFLHKNVTDFPSEIELQVTEIINKYIYENLGLIGQVHSIKKGEVLIEIRDPSYIQEITMHSSQIKNMVFNEIGKNIVKGLRTRVNEKLWIKIPRNIENLSD